MNESAAIAEDKASSLNEHQIMSLGEFGHHTPSYFQELLVHKENEGTTPHEYSFYLNSSDSLETIMRVEMTGKKILTVSGSGEFAHAFIYSGADEVISFDVSPIAAFASELRHEALCHLNMQDYMKLFGGWVNFRDEEGEDSIWDEETYHKLEPHLSKEVKGFFNTLFEHPGLNSLDENTSGGVSRARYNEKTKQNRFIGDIITSEDDYKKLQEKAIKVKFSQVICDVNSMQNSIPKLSPDVAFISNIGYRPNTIIGIARRLTQEGIPEVICTLNKHEEWFNGDWGDNDYDSEKFYQGGSELKKGSKYYFIQFDEETHEEFEPDVEIVGLDRNADFGITLRVKEESL